MILEFKKWDGLSTKKGYNMDIMNLNRETTNIGQPGFTTFLLSYSTADIEKNIFFGEIQEQRDPYASVGRITIRVVHGEIYELSDQAIPVSANPLSDQSAIFSFIGINNQENL